MRVWGLLTDRPHSMSSFSTFSFVFVKNCEYIFSCLCYSVFLWSPQKEGFPRQSELFTLLRRDKTQMDSSLETELSV